MNGVAATFVVPCYNEEARLDGPAMLALIDGAPGLSLLFVNDGSRDGTLRLLESLVAKRPARLGVLSLASNAGKAEAVRQGMRASLAGPCDLIGYFDADLSTPPAEVLRLVDLIEQRGASAVIGARVALLGSDIHRAAIRHYLGRLFATIASQVLGLRVYDTQCGAKIFRRSPTLVASIEAPFLSRWAFDVELLGRLLTGAPATPPLDAGTLIEMPLREWRDVAGSKLGPKAMAGALRDLVSIGADLRRRRQLMRH